MAQAEPTFLGRFCRGQTVGLYREFLAAPDAAPLCRVYRAGVLQATFRLPLVERVRLRFGLTRFLGPEHADGPYWAVVTWAEAAVAQVADLQCYHVLGGEGKRPVVAITELERPLGTAVVHADDGGAVNIGYNPRRP